MIDTVSCKQSYPDYIKECIFKVNLLYKSQFFLIVAQSTVRDSKVDTILQIMKEVLQQLTPWPLFFFCAAHGPRMKLSANFQWFSLLSPYHLSTYNSLKGSAHDRHYLWLTCNHHKRTKNRAKGTWVPLNAYNWRCGPHSIYAQWDEIIS